MKRWPHWILLIAIASVSPPRGSAAEPTLVGSPSCSTSTCHGGVIGAGPEWHSSLSTWMLKDPHAGAGLLLRDDDSRRIVVMLDPAAADSSVAYDNVLRTRCISCHVTVTPQETSPLGKLADLTLARGVSCESCHGPASEWLSAHVQANWKGPQRFSPATGMRDTESIIGRSDTCVRCHIGSRSEDGLVRDMNHDLIAAGHPALRFDLLVYNQNQPSHWNPKADTEAEFNKSAIRVRSVGRAINLAAAAKLSSERATASLQDRNVPWPELSDYDCFACHQTLSIRDYRYPRGEEKLPDLKVSDGLPIWNAWHTINQVTLSRKTLDILSPRKSDAELLSTKCAEISTLYRGTAKKRMSVVVDPLTQRNKIFADLRSAAPDDWHQAALQYLDLDAALRDLRKNSDTVNEATRMSEALREAEKLLRFDPERSPTQSSVRQSPSRFDAEAFREKVLSVQASNQAKNSSSDQASKTDVSRGDEQQFPSLSSVVGQP